MPRIITILLSRARYIIRWLKARRNSEESEAQATPNRTDAPAERHTTPGDTALDNDRHEPPDGDADRDETRDEDHEPTFGERISRIFYDPEYAKERK